MNGACVSSAAGLSPKIRGALAPGSLGDWPTPLESAPGLAAACGAAALWLKREDRSSRRCGGNKVRGLEFLLGPAPADVVYLTAGGTGSSHCPRRSGRSEEHTSELQSPCNLVCRLLLEKKKKLH